jgi:hypothetical protein
LKHIFFASSLFIFFVSKASIDYYCGNYTGDGNATQSISGVGFQPEVILVKADHVSYDGWIATSTMDAGDAKELTGTNVLATGRINSFDVDGFTVGTDDDANAIGVTYYYIAFNANADLEVGTYTGNTGTQEVDLAGGFSPEMVWLLGDAGDATDKAFMGMKSNGNEGVYFSDGIFGSTNYMSTYDSDGFTVGAWINTNTKVYHYVAFNESASSLVESTYIGDGNPTLSITGVGYQPDFVMIQSAGNSGVPSFRTSLMGPDEALSFNAAAAGTEYIKSLDADGFTVGTDNATNATGNTYIYTAFGGGTVLPVELVYFNAKLENQNNAFLEWKTSSEINNEKFVIQKSYDGVNYYEIGEILGAGNSFETNSYTFTDSDITSEKVYYRLKQVDFDGHFKFYETKFLSLKSNGDLHVFPNPIAKGDAIYFNTPFEGKCSIHVYNSMGELMYVQLIPNADLNSNIEIYTTFPAGNYFIQVFNDLELFSKSIIVQ